MRGREVIKAIEGRGGQVVRQRGSHVRVTCACGVHSSTVPDHGGHDVAPGTLRSIERDLAPCAAFGPRWLRKG